MSEVLVQPLRSYMDRGAVRKAGGAPYLTAQAQAKQLEARGLARIIEAEVPKQEAGVSPSASPAAPASQPTTVSRSENGGKRHKRAR
ncbi:hypothetical protein D9M68_202280 [compost metagenome]